MSNLTQAKREAKRLFNIAKSNDNNLNIKSLNEAQKILAIINGYKDWYDFEIALHKKDALMPFKEKQKIHQYLSDEDKYNLKRYYIDNPVFKKQIFADHVFQHNNNNKHERVWFSLGVEANSHKKLFTKEKEVFFSPRNAAFWGDGGKYDAQLILRKYMVSNSCVSISYDALGPVLYQNIKLEKDILNRLLLLNLNINASFTHTIDPINSFIPFKKEFLKTFNLIEKEEITEIFYSLCKFYHDKKYALTSLELQSFLSLKWLSVFDEDLKIKNTISDYLLKLKLSPEDIQNEYFFENKNQEIQSHHLSIFNTQKVLDAIHKFEKKGVFSPEAQIDFDDIFYNRKVLFINYPQYNVNDYEMNSLSNIINCLFLIKLQQYNNYHVNIIPKDVDGIGKFSCFNLIENMNVFLNDDTYPLLLTCSGNFADNWPSPFFFVFDDFQSLNLKYENLLVNTFQHIFLRMDTTIPPAILTQKILYHCSNIPESFFNEYNNPLKSLTAYERYYIGKYREKYDEYKKFPLGTFKNKLEIYHINIRLGGGNVQNKDIYFNQVANIRKIL